MSTEFHGRQDIQGGFKRDRDNNAPRSSEEMHVTLCTHAQFAGRAVVLQWPHR